MWRDVKNTTLQRFRDDRRCTFSRLRGPGRRIPRPRRELSTTGHGIPVVSEGTMISTG